MWSIELINGVNETTVCSHSGDLRGFSSSPEVPRDQGPITESTGVSSADFSVGQWTGLKCKGLDSNETRLHFVKIT